MASGQLDDKALNLFKRFLNEVLNAYGQALHSVHITGSALTADFDPRRSDINSVFVLKQMDLNFLTVLAPLGRKYGKKRIAAPLIMTPAYISGSLDVFPIEFLNFKLLHFTVSGEDLFKNIQIQPPDLRLQCEREIKAKLIGLRQAYIRSAGERKLLSENIVAAITAYIPLFRAIICLLGKAPPLNTDEVLDALNEISGVDVEAFRSVVRHKKDRSALTLQELETVFRNYYSVTEKLGAVIDAAAD